MLAFARLARAQDLRRVVSVDVLGKSLEELGELPGSLVAELGQFQDQTGTLGDVVGGPCWFVHGCAPVRGLSSSGRAARGVGFGSAEDLQVELLVECGDL